LPGDAIRQGRKKKSKDPEWEKFKKQLRIQGSRFVERKNGSNP